LAVIFRGAHSRISFRAEMKPFVRTASNEWPIRESGMVRGPDTVRKRKVASYR